MGEYIGYSRLELAKQFDLASDKVIEFNRRLVEQVFGNAKHDFTTVIDKNKKERMLVYRAKVDNVTAKMVNQLRKKEYFGLHITHLYSLLTKPKLRIELEIRVARVFAEYNFAGQPIKSWEKKND